MSAAKASELGVKPLAKIICGSPPSYDDLGRIYLTIQLPAYADAGVDPIDFPAAPTLAIPKALKKAGLAVDDVSLFEINEAFSVVVNIAEKVLNIPRSKVNVNGGAVALGHAIGNSGSRIVVSLVHALQPGQYGVAGVCNGVSLGLPLTKQSHWFLTLPSHTGWRSLCFGYSKAVSTRRAVY
jgi:acetyl-CoA C-acetyltransferase